MRELEDLLFTREQTGALIDELASIIEPSGIPHSIVDIDHFMWNHHPRTRTTSVFPHIGGFFRNPATRTSTSGAWSYSRTLVSADFEGMTHFFKDFVAPRAGSVTTHNSTWEHWNGWELHASQFTDSGIPDTPTVQYTGAAGFPGNGLTFETSGFSNPGGSFGAMKWRVAEVTPHTSPLVGAVSSPAVRGKYEINADWESPELTTFSSDVLIPAASVTAGKTYRVRCKMKDSSGHWGHWSDAVEFVAGAANVSSWLDHLVVTEFMYHPATPSGAELVVSTDKDDFEFLEIWNSSETESLSLAELSFTDGVEFTFSGGAIQSLGPMEYALVVKDLAAFEIRYGTGLPVAGEYSGKLANGGERVALTFAGGTVIREWEYDDVAPWPMAADGNGSSMVLQNPGSIPDHALAPNWLAGPVNAATPGAEETAPPLDSFAAWQNETFSAAELADPAFSGANADPDGDDRANLLEWALAGDALVNDPSSLNLIQIEEDGNQLMALRFNRPEGAVGVVYELMGSSDLSNWEVVPSIPIVENSLGGGIEQVRLVDDQAVLNNPGSRFLRVRVSLSN